MFDAGKASRACPRCETVGQNKSRFALVTAAFSSITALLLSVLMPIGGNSPVGIATPLRARIEGFPDLTIGLLGSVYFAGMLARTLAAPAIVRRGGISGLSRPLWRSQSFR